jgi:hypothetical protein
MTDSPIEPALTSEEWAEIRDHPEIAGYTALEQVIARNTCDGGSFTGVNDPSPIIAACNAMLDDNDPRKITWAMVDALRKWAKTEGELMDSGDAGRTGVDIGIAEDLADALASYLPPREP